MQASQAQSMEVLQPGGSSNVTKEQQETRELQPSESPQNYTQNACAKHMRTHVQSSTTQ